MLHATLEVEVGVETFPAENGRRRYVVFHGSGKDRVTSHFGELAHCVTTKTEKNGKHSQQTVFVLLSAKLLTTECSRAAR